MFQNDDVARAIVEDKHKKMRDWARRERMYLESGMKKEHRIIQRRQLQAVVRALVVAIVLLVGGWVLMSMWGQVNAAPMGTASSLAGTGFTYHGYILK